jgi:hypothetical protein
MGINCWPMRSLRARSAKASIPMGTLVPGGGSGRVRNTRAVGSQVVVSVWQRAGLSSGISEAITATLWPVAKQ